MNWYKYGGGLMFKSTFLNEGETLSKYPKANRIYGHSGMNYASETHLTGYNK